MLIRVDARVTPPAVAVERSDDFTSFKVVVNTAAHVWIAPESVASLIPGATDEWRKAFEGMVAYAASQGWTDDAGRVRAHVEVVAD